MRPTLKFLRSGVPATSDRQAIAALARRREFLLSRRTLPRAGASYDRLEASALEWALLLARYHRRKGDEMSDPEFARIEREREDRLAEEAGEALGADDGAPTQREEESCEASADRRSSSTR